jgi:hypothetical protein
VRVSKGMVEIETISPFCLGQHKIFILVYSHLSFTKRKERKKQKEKERNEETFFMNVTLENFFNPRTDDDTASCLVSNSLEVKEGQFNKGYK